ncbi:hypothetical protein T01_9657 [Trichinella spiralis]|uniref:Uncharacterized protein n=1 Tax=Trichinella spiralis TaxID=6334 RepID=A0A0V1BF66_TRISP|nr:hypothetical protein T01_9657 [Trichinella spiralis]
MVAFQREEKPKTTSCLVMMLMVGCNGRGEEKVKVDVEEKIGRNSSKQERSKQQTAAAATTTTTTTTAAATSSSSGNSSSCSNKQWRQQQKQNRQQGGGDLLSGGSNRPIGLRVGESPGAPCRAPLWLCVQWFGWEICLPVQGQCSTNPLVTSRLCLLSEFGKKSDSCPLLSTACAGRVRGAEPAPLFLSVGQHTPAISHSGSS